MKTYMPKEAQIERKWYVVDANGMALGRVASQVAAVLRGKHKPTYAPHMDTGDYVIVLNTDKIILTGKKLEQKIHFHHTGYVGNAKYVGYKELMSKNSDEAFRLAVKGMLPKNSLGRKMIKKLKIYKGAEHNHEAQQPQPLTLKGGVR